ncbi:MAG TPA: CHAD domain-containing protein [Draconibacterium sp.]|nr:CHAD domain-containing protein [Draconibacterium sp.]
MPHRAGKQLTETIAKQLERVEYFCTAENISPNLAVHEMRKTFKRMRALLRFYNAFPEEFSPDFILQIKYFARALTHLRESFVNLQIFERITAGNTMLPERKIRAARELFAEKNREVVEKGFFAAEGCDTIMKFTGTLAAQLVDVSLPVPSQLQIAAELEDTYLKSHQIYQQITVFSNPEMIHELRKKMKQLYYQFDFIRFVHPRFFRLKTYHLNNITEQLGEDHDLHVFLVELKSGFLDFINIDLQILENQVHHHRELNLIKLNPRLKQFFKDLPEEFNLKMEKIFKVEV